MMAEESEEVVQTLRSRVAELEHTLEAARADAVAKAGQVEELEGRLSQMEAKLKTDTEESGSAATAKELTGSEGQAPYKFSLFPSAYSFPDYA